MVSTASPLDHHHHVSQLIDWSDSLLCHSFLADLLSPIAGHCHKTRIELSSFYFEQMLLFIIIGGWNRRSKEGSQGSRLRIPLSGPWKSVAFVSFTSASGSRMNASLRPLVSGSRLHIKGERREGKVKAKAKRREGR